MASADTLIGRFVEDAEAQIKDMKKRATEQKTQLDYFLLGITTGILALTANALQTNEYLFLLCISWAMLFTSLALGITHQELRLDEVRTCQRFNSAVVDVCKELGKWKTQPVEERESVDEPLSVMKDSGERLLTNAVKQRHSYRWQVTLLMLGMAVYAVYRILLVL